jgi:hypothetical protein
MSLVTTGRRSLIGSFIAIIALIDLSLTPAVRAQQVASASVDRIEPLVVNGQLAVDIDVSLELNDTMRQALSRGVPLYFSIDLKIEQPRWWWFDKTIVETSLERRLSYNALTRSWRVSTGDLSIPTSSYADALELLTRARNWPVVLSDRFNPDEQYVGDVRIRLNAEQLARPLQMDSASRSNWSLSSPWKSFEFSIRRDPKAQP